MASSLPVVKQIPCSLGSVEDECITKIWFGSLAYLLLHISSFAVCVERSSKDNCVVVDCTSLPRDILQGHGEVYVKDKLKLRLYTG